MSSSIKKYDVFLSFRGEDTRRDFTGHLCDALEKKLIKTYMDCLLDRGEDVWPALAKAIDNSQVSIVVFSENYATSSWCLQELVRILERRKDQGQVVIPVFYETDPSDIRNQTGVLLGTRVYGKAFAKYEGDLGDKDNESNRQRVNSWKAALTEAANISGWHSRTHRDDVELIENVVNDVSQKRNLRRSIELKGLVRTKEICRKVQLYMNKFRVVGIWGMPGIGKTTIAKVLFAELFPQFDNVCFVANVKEYSLDRLLFELLKEVVPGITFDMGRLNSKKVFIVLDDVNSSDQLLEYLCREFRDQNQDSRLIITTRNKQLLEGKVDLIHKVEEWNNPESLQLFSLEAFDKTEPPKGFEDLAARAVKYAGGVPLALKVLGLSLRSKNTQFWESTLRKLDKYLNEGIQSVLKVSYDGLDDLEKKIFLDIAFFFNGEKKDHVISILDACGFEASSGIEVLADKALITISYSNVIEMHDLLQKLAFQIERQESSRNLEGRSRLRDIEEVSAVLQDNKGTDAVEGIIVDLSLMNDLHLGADTFKRMNNLRFLKFYISLGQSSSNVSLPRALESFSDKLRYLQWDGYPLESLPPTFCAKLLVEIRMSHSHVKQLWQGTQELDYLEAIDLSESKQLEELPDLSTASRLKWVNLSGCESLPILHSSVLSSDTLVTLILDGCTNLSSIKSKKHLKSLQNISVNGCSSLKEFAVSSDLIENLDLSKTGIETLDTSIGLLQNLRQLNLEGLGLKNLPEELSYLTSLMELKLSSRRLDIDKHQLRVLFGGLKSQQILHLKECRKLFELPDNIGAALSKLQDLRLDGSSVKSLPASIKDLQELEILSLKNCAELKSLPELPPFIKKFNVENCTSLVSVSNLKTFATKMVGKVKRVSFKNSLNLDGRSLHSIMESLYLTMVSAAVHNVLVRRYGVDVLGYNYNSVEVCVPGSRVPGQFIHQTNKSSSITIQLPMPSNFLGFIYYVVLSPSQREKKHGAKIQCKCHLAGGTKATWQDKAISELKSDHVYIWYDPFHCDFIRIFNEPKVYFEFSATTDTGEVDASISIKECGVHLISVSELHNVLPELDSDKKKELEKEFEFDLGHNKATMPQQSNASEDHRQVRTPFCSPPIEMKKGSSNEKESKGMRNQTPNQQRDLSEQTSFDCKVEESESATLETHARCSDHYSDVEKSTESGCNETMTGAGMGHRDNNRESTKDVKSKGNEGKPTESDAGLLLPIDSCEEENVSENISIENYYDQPKNIEESKQPEESPNPPRQQSIAHPDSHDLTVEEPYQEKENEQMSVDQSEVLDESDEDPIAELESILKGSQKPSPKAACSTSDIAVKEALHNLECLLEKSLENILGDLELQRQLKISLECLEQASHEKVSPSVAELAKSITSFTVDLFKGFASMQKVVEDHTNRLKRKDKLVQRVDDAKKQRGSLEGKVNQLKFQAESLDREAEDLDEKIRLFVEQKRMVQMEQTKLKEALEECDGEKKKLRDEAKNWVAESKDLMSAIENSKASYDAAISEQEELNQKWEDFRTSFAHNCIS